MLPLGFLLSKILPLRLCVMWDREDVKHVASLHVWCLR